MSRSCSTCKHHSHTQRPRVVGVFDAELEMIEEDDTELEDVYTCQHQSMQSLVVIGNESATKKASDCVLFEQGSKSGLPAHLQRLLERSEERAHVHKER